MSKNLPSGHFLVLCVGAAFLFTAFFMAGTLAPLYAAFIAAPPAVIGIVVSAMFVLPLGLAIPVGTLTDRISPRIMLVVGLIVIASAPIALALRPSLTTLLLMQVLVGLGQLAAVLGAQKSVTRFRAGLSREAAFGWYSAFVSLGQMLGPIVAGSLVDFRGFQTAFVATAAVAVGGAVAFALLRLPPAESQDSFESKPRERRRPGTALVGLLGLESVQVSLVVSATVMIVMVAHNSFLPAFLEGFAVPATVIGAVVSARSLAAAIVRTFISQIVRSLGGRMTTFVVMLSLAGAGVAGIGLGPSLVAQLTAALLLGIAVGVAQPLTMVTMVDDVAVDQQGFALGVRITANRLAQFLSPLMLGAIAQWVGYSLTFVVAGALIAAMAWVAWVLGARRRIIATPPE